MRVSPSFTRVLACGVAAATLSSVPLLAKPIAAQATHYRLVARVPLAGAGGWDYLTCDPAANRLYITRGDRVDVVNLKTRAVVGHVPGLAGVHGVALDARLHRGFTSNGRDNTVTVFDTRTLHKIGLVKVGNRPDAIVFDPAAGRVFTLNGGSNDASAVDARTLKVVGTVKLGGRPEFAAADGHGRLYVNIEDKSQVVEVDSRALVLRHRWSMSPGQEPSGLTLDAGTERVFSTCHNGMMTVLNGENGKVVAAPPIGKGPDAAQFDPARRLAFSSNGMDGSITVIREVSPKVFRVVQTVPTVKGARTMAIDTRTHFLYLVTAKFAPNPPGPPPAGQPRWRRNTIPGTFELLVVSPR